MPDDVQQGKTTVVEKSEPKSDKKAGNYVAQKVASVRHPENQSSVKSTTVTADRFFRAYQSR